MTDTFLKQFGHYAEKMGEQWRLDNPEIMDAYQAATEKPTDGPHPSHTTRYSDSSHFDEICTKCGATDISGGGWGRLALPCAGEQK